MSTGAASAVAPEGRSGWCCVQAGHRERYGIPRALHRVGVLDRLVTDVWAQPGSLAALLARGVTGRRLRDRYHSELPPSRVAALSGRAFAWEFLAGLRGLRGRRRQAARQVWWERTSRDALARSIGPSTGSIFVYCYEALGLFQLAAKRGLAPVLGQIDPGPFEDRKVAEIVRRWPAYRTPFRPGSEAYYGRWREECRLAGHVVVNSKWSADALEREGVDPTKIAVLPLVYTPPGLADGWKKLYPKTFSRERPLRVLFLGQCILRKGIAETIAAARDVADLPVEFTLVGNTDIEDLESHFGRARIRYATRVSREECGAFYREADLFLFPTHSDGFGLTQLEAQAWKLPIVASRFCAEVVVDDVTGRVLDEVSPESVAQVVRFVADRPDVLGRWSSAIQPWHFEMEQLGRGLCALVSAGAQSP